MNILSNSITERLKQLFKSVQTAWSATNFTQNNLVEKLSYFNCDSKEDSFFPFKSNSKAELRKIEIKNGPLRRQLKVFHHRLIVLDPELTQLQEDVIELLSKAYSIWLFELAKVINANPVGFDGAPHFSNIHPINPTLSLDDCYSNDAGAVELDEDGLRTSLKLLVSAPDLDGSVDTNRVKRVVIVVPTHTLHFKATTAVAAIEITDSNEQDCCSFEVILLPQLVTSVAATQKQWYLINVTSVVERAFVTSIVEYPSLTSLTGADPYDYSRLQNDGISISWTAKGGVGVGLPREVVRAIAP